MMNSSQLLNFIHLMIRIIVTLGGFSLAIGIFIFNTYHDRYERYTKNKEGLSAKERSLCFWQIFKLWIALMVNIFSTTIFLFGIFIIVLIHYYRLLDISYIATFLICVYSLGMIFFLVPIRLFLITKPEI